MSLQLKDPWENISPTPLLQISSRLYAKLETVNPTGSIKDRPIKFIVENALKRGEICSSSTLVEATSGNTGIALAAIGASLGLPVKIIMPRNMSLERRQMMILYGASIIEVADSDFEGAINKRNDLVAKGCWSPMQFENRLNIECHRLTTAAEILDQLPPNEPFSAFFSGAGTGGTIMGVRQALLDNSLDTHVCMVKPFEAADQHGIQGIGDGSDFLANPDLFDLIQPIKTKDAKNRVLTFAKTHGVLVGISSGANLLAAETYIKTFNPTGNVVTILCDRGERYLSEFKKP